MSIALVGGFAGASAPLETAAKPPDYRAKYAAFVKEQRDFLLRSAFGGSSATAGARSTTSDGVLNYTDIPDLPKPGFAAKAHEAPPVDAAPPLKSLSELFAKSSASAATALAAYKKGGGTSALLDRTA